VEETGITHQEFEENIKRKKIAILTRKMSHLTLDDNPIYRDPLYQKLVYAAHSDLTGKETFHFETNFNIKVKLLSKNEDAFVQVAKDLRSQT
jgi:hypothetical protein